MNRIGIVAAWQPEIGGLIRRLPPSEQYKVGAWDFNIHRIHDLEVVSVVCGVGKVYSASCTQLLISKFSPSEMYMTGICGGLGNELSGVHLVIPERTLQHDVQSPGSSNDPWDLYEGRSAYCMPDSLLLRRFRDFILTSTIPTHFGMVVSGDQRIRSTERSDFLRREFNAIAVDQEIAAFAHVCTLNQTPFLCVKAVSDKADEQTEQDQQKYKLQACDLASETIVEFVMATV